MGRTPEKRNKNFFTNDEKKKDELKKTFKKTNQFALPFHPTAGKR